MIVYHGVYCALQNVFSSRLLQVVEELAEMLEQGPVEPAAVDALVIESTGISEPMPVAETSTFRVVKLHRLGRDRGHAMN